MRRNPGLGKTAEHLPHSNDNLIGAWDPAWREQFVKTYNRTGMCFRKRFAAKTGAEFVKMQCCWTLGAQPA